MPTTYAKNKKHIYNWRENNLDVVREKNKNYMVKYMRWKRIQKEYLAILII